MKNIYILLFALVIGLVSCVDDDMYPNADQPQPEEPDQPEEPVAIDYSVIILNELDGNQKFIELYNSGETDIDLSGCYIEKDEEKNWTANGITLKAGEYLLLWGEDAVAEGEDHEGYDAKLVFNSGLSAKKDVKIELFDPNGESISKFDLTKEDDRDEENSYSRNADKLWYYATPTPGTANIDGTTKVLTVN